MKDETGATAVEYGIIASVLSMTVIGGMGVAFDAVKWLWADNNSQISLTLDKM